MMKAQASLCLDPSHAELIAGGGGPWSPARRERYDDVERAALDETDKPWCMAEVEIFADLTSAEMDALAQAAPMRRYAAGSLVFTPHEPVEALFILKMGRIRTFRVSPDGRALTTAILEPGTIFGEMVIVGQQMHDSFAEALDDVAVCYMTRADVRRLLLNDPRIATRITETLGKRLGELEQKLSDAVFKSVPERIAGTLATLAAESNPRGRSAQIKLTHEQLAALAATSRETTTKILGEFAASGLISLGRGRIQVLDVARLRRQSGP